MVSVGRITARPARSAATACSLTEEVGQRGAERLGLLDVDEVARVHDRDEAGVPQRADDRVGAGRAADEVVPAGDYERRSLDLPQLGAQIEGREFDGVEVV